jgi:2-iminobutanoate/2-iminopropanoate deaminase
MKKIETKNAPAAIGPYSQAVEAGNMVFISGQIPVNPETGEIPEGITAQAKRSLENLKAILEKAGLGTENVVKTTVFLQNMGDFSELNSVYETYFEGIFPARSCVEVAALPKGVLVEIEAIAVK